MTATEAPARPSRRRSTAGFTMIELIMVMAMAGILATYVLPRLSNLNSAGFDGWHDEVLSTLQYARNSALSHRRLVCVTVAARSITLQVASVNPATTCNTSLRGPNDNTAIVSTGKDVATSVSPAGVLYMQPDGRVTTDGGGNTTAVFTVSMNGAASITIQGETGHVE